MPLVHLMKAGYFFFIINAIHRLARLLNEEPPLDLSSFSFEGIQGEVSETAAGDGRSRFKRLVAILFVAAIGQSAIDDQTERTH